MPDINKKIQEVSLYYYPAEEGCWLGLAVFVADVGDKNAPGEGYNSFQLSSGWRIQGYFFTSNTGVGVADFIATKLFDGVDKLTVWGDYGGSDNMDGVYSRSEEALKDFLDCHPPFDVD